MNTANNQNAEPEVFDIDYWDEKILPILMQHKLNYHYNDDEKELDIKNVSKKMVHPILLLCVMQMRIFHSISTPKDAINEQLEAFMSVERLTNNFGFLVLSQEQSGFVNRYKAEVEAWLPIIVKKYIIPNKNRVKDILSGSI